MRRFVLPGLVVCAAVALIALLAFGVAGQGTNTSIDSALARGDRPTVPDASVALPVLGSSGTRKSVADLKGKLVVLNVFASWCDPCKAEAPILERAQRQLVGHDGTVLGVTYLDNSSDAAAFVRREHINYPVVRDVGGSFARAYGANGIPETFVLDRNGHVAWVRRYQLAGAALQQALSRVLGASA